jgi:hypothetical protein
MNGNFVRVMEEILQLVEHLDDAAWTAGNESGQGACDQGSYRAEKEANRIRQEIKAKLQAKIRELLS